MATVASALRKWKALQENLPRLISEVLEENKHLLLEANRRQLRQGRTSENSRFRRYKSAAYAAKKAKQNPLAGGYPDLISSGAYIESFAIELRGSVVNYLATNVKAFALETRFDENLIYGVTPDNRTRIINDVLKPALITKVKQFLSQ